MMKLLLIYFILLFVFLIKGSGMGQNIAGGGISVETVLKGDPIPGGVVRAELSEVNQGRIWNNRFVLMLKSLVHTKQLDLPDDQGNCWNIPCKVIHADRQAESAARLRVTIHPGKFARLLSARHANGFYFYSLRKLII